MNQLKVRKLIIELQAELNKEPLAQLWFLTKFDAPPGMIEFQYVEDHRMVEDDVLEEAGRKFRELLRCNSPIEFYRGVIGANALDAEHYDGN